MVRYYRGAVCLGQNHALIENQAHYSPDLLPTPSEARTWKIGQFFSIWMGSVHNVPSYVTIGGFFALGLSSWQVFFIIIFSSILLSVMMVLNGHAGSNMEFHSLFCCVQAMEKRVLSFQGS